MKNVTKESERGKCDLGQSSWDLREEKKSENISNLIVTIDEATRESFPFDCRNLSGWATRRGGLTLPRSPAKILTMRMQ